MILVGGDNNITYPRRNLVGGDVSPASPAGLTPMGQEAKMRVILTKNLLAHVDISVIEKSVCRIASLLF